MTLLYPLSILLEPCQTTKRLRRGREEPGWLWPRHILWALELFRQIMLLGHSVGVWLHVWPLRESVRPQQWTSPEWRMLQGHLALRKELLPIDSEATLLQRDFYRLEADPDSQSKPINNVKAGKHRMIIRDIIPASAFE